MATFLGGLGDLGLGGLGDLGFGAGLCNIFKTFTGEFMLTEFVKFVRSFLNSLKYG
jgi:hypothetical protein